MALTQEDMATITQLIRAETEQLRAELDAVDEWANGLFLALKDVLTPLLKRHPEVAAELAPRWQKVVEEFHRTEGGRLEARKMLYSQLALVSVWPSVDSSAFAEEPIKRTRGPHPR
ncbi:hypothetical protein MO867_20785 [Microbulbifer sp. OS29]|uniref:Uncharacterized protein n=1 Tax=Microbulbifer okhotskensis TaxID=2926617 RepID=A0A9X2EQZ2_9GAMM|nr:hypothetical protein [Microbulbifer okhotskensis]MCO1336767.1 hypothetical protein [Microbulbifer okhotskensis]